MHRIDADSHVGNLFDEGDPGAPRAPTQVDADWLNAVQEEICNAITNAGLTLTKGTNTQLRSALVNILTAQTIAGKKTFTGAIDVSGASTGVPAGNFYAATPHTALKAQGQGSSAKAVHGLADDGTAVLGEVTGTGRAGHFKGGAVRFESLAAYPLSPAVGDVVYYGPNSKLYCWDGSAWNAFW